MNTWFSSANGVVLPTLIPTVLDIVANVGGNVTIVEMIIAIVGGGNRSGNQSPFYWRKSYSGISVTYYQFNKEEGTLEAKQILPTLPDTYTGDGWASGIIMSASGKYVIISNRKHDSITSFEIQQDTGFLKFCDCIKTGGKQPRFITLDEKGEKILVANELTDTITEFELDEENGKFKETGRKIETESPVCVIFITI